MVQPTLDRGMKRRVRFATELCSAITVPSLSQMSKEERQHRYWQESEFLALKASAKMAVHDITTYNRKAVDLIDSLYSYVVCLSDSLDDDEFSLLISDPSDLARALQSWQSRSVGRGLEKYVSSVHREQRYDAVEESRSTVLSLANLTCIDADEVALSYNEQARSATLYARLVGMADAMVVKGDECVQLKASHTLAASGLKHEKKTVQSQRLVLSSQFGNSHGDQSQVPSLRLSAAPRLEGNPRHFARPEPSHQCSRYYDATRRVMPKRVSV